MNNEEAARILDPETSREALAPYAHDCQLRLAVTEEACTVAAKVLRDTARISVKDRLPEPSKKVLCFLDLGHGSLVETGYFMLDDGWYYTGVEAPHHGCVTHWMPLPEPPKEY